ncbi:S9 family peptidase [Gulosibacter hominis]|uniref:S9 family peptidase n=1 Tax=Gulosibacter hominis TaxID=2770504 RepID=UPI001918A34E|nr:S9 family peptidase [Gulosibacter hominis]
MTAAEFPTPPVVRQEPHRREVHGDVFVDSYEWLRDKSSSEVIAHLEAENAYTDAVTAAQEPLREAIFGEIQRRTHEASVSLPSRRGNWWYFSRMIEGGQHPIYCRIAATEPAAELAGWVPPVLDPDSPRADEQVLLDANAQSQQHDFYSVGSLDISPDGRLLAHTEDTTGDERYTLQIRDLESGELLADSLGNIGPVVEFLPDGKSLLYTVIDESWRPNELRIHCLGEDPASDVLLWHEADPEMWLGGHLSDDRRFIVASAGNSELDEVRLWPLVADTDLPQGQLTTLISRSARLRYEVQPVSVDGTSQLAILHHEGQPNGELVLAEVASFAEGPVESIAALGPRVLIAGSDTDRLLSLSFTGEYLVVDAMHEALPQVLVISVGSAGGVLQPQFAEELVGVTHHELEFGAPVLRLDVQSWVHPDRQFEIAFDALTRGEAPQLRRQTEVRDYDGSDYVARREWAVVRDGTRVPITLLHHVRTALDGTAPAIIYGYGSYEISMEPALSLPVASVLDRGAVFAVAHIRGGGELGRSWYEDGKKANKPNSFTDFVDATEHLVSAGLVDGERLAAVGGSAGGLLMGAVANLAPERYRAIVAQVPFVDPLTSILDPDLPLSALEWEEWGNPITDPEAYATIKGYSPYENIRPVAYPQIAAVTSLHDTRVLYVEPAKWVARLREITTGDAPIVLKTEMHGGHGGGSGRYQRWRDRAWDYAFMLHAIGAEQTI